MPNYISIFFTSFSLLFTTFSLFSFFFFTFFSLFALFFLVFIILPFFYFFVVNKRQFFFENKTYFFPQTQTSPFNGCKRKPSVYGSRHLTYDIPFPMDECNIDEIEIRRRPSRRHPNQSLFARMSHKKSPLRTNSLNVRELNADRMPVTRNISSPSTMEHPNNHRYVMQKRFIYNKSKLFFKNN